MPSSAPGVHSWRRPEGRFGLVVVWLKYDPISTRTIYSLTVVFLDAFYVLLGFIHATGLVDQIPVVICLALAHDKESVHDPVILDVLPINSEI